MLFRSQPEETWDAVWNTAMVYSLFANTVLVMQGDHIELFRIFPVDGRPDLAAMETTLYVPTPVETADQRRETFAIEACDGVRGNGWGRWARRNHARISRCRTRKTRGRSGNKLITALPPRLRE